MNFQKFCNIDKKITQNKKLINRLIFIQLEIDSRNINYISSVNNIFRLYSLKNIYLLQYFLKLNRNYYL